MKLKDIFNKKLNSNNKQIALDVRKRILKKLDLDIDDILDIEICKKEKKFRF